MRDINAVNTWLERLGKSHISCVCGHGDLLQELKKDKLRLEKKIKKVKF